LPELIQARRATGRQLRIWSAGCCTGEEAYSLAMTLRRVLPDISDWRITLLATDVNPRFLKKAGEGRYSNWSFRGAPDLIPEQYFHRAPDGTRELALEIKRMVSFAALNLAEDVYPSLMNDTNAMDVIFCRNVLMYFSRTHAARVAGKLHHCLVNGGWLFASPTEGSHDIFPQFAVERTPEVIAFRRQDEPVAPRGDLAVAKPRRAAKPIPTERKAVADAVPTEPAGRAPDLALARGLANEGRLADALVECDKVIAGDKLVAAGHYLRGMILQENGAFAEARDALRRALFLDHDLVVAHFALGNLLRRKGRGQEAARSLENARALLQKYAPDAELPESDGVTAGRLLAMVESIQDMRL
jgi:chemotaxis protein methyltransferase CheR